MFEIIDIFNGHNVTISNMYKIYHNPKCRKSREGLQYLETGGMHFEIKKYIEEGLSINELKEITTMLGLKPLDLIRTSEAEFKKNFKGKTMTDEQWLEVIAQNPKFLKRPIVVRNGKAVLAQPASKIIDLK